MADSLRRITPLSKRGGRDATIRIRGDGIQQRGVDHDLRRVHRDVAIIGLIARTPAQMCLAGDHVERDGEVRRVVFDRAIARRTAAAGEDRPLPRAEAGSIQGLGDLGETTQQIRREVGDNCGSPRVRLVPMLDLVDSRFDNPA
jgi:hypothetical protein